MKRLFFTLVVTALILGCTAALAAGKTYQSAGFEYELKSNGDAILIKYTGSSNAVVIPNDLDGHPITAVRENPFIRNGEAMNCRVSVAADHPYLATIDGVLFGMSDKKLIYCPPSMSGTYEIRKGISIIGSKAFFKCERLTEVIIPDSVKSIWDGAFYGCTGMQSVVLPKGIEELGHFMDFYGVFQDCGIKSVTIPKSVTKIGDNAFYGCKYLTTLTIPDGVTEIGSFAFCNCSGLTSIVLPAKLTAINRNVFYGCSSLTDVVIPDGVKRIEMEAFLSCTSLGSVVIPSSVTSIGQHAFEQYSFEKRQYSALRNLVLTVAPGSYAETWCKENGLSFVTSGTTYSDRDDWLD